MSNTTNTITSETKENADSQLYKMNESAKMPLMITNDVIKVGGTVYPVRNIASSAIIKKRITKIKDPTIRPGFLMVGIILIASSFGIGSVFIFFLGAAISILSIILTETYPNEYFDYYGIQIQTNSGSQDLVFSQDKSFMEKVSNLIVEALSSNGKSNNYTINIADKIINDNSTNIQNNKVNYISNFDIKIEHHGLSKDDLEFLLGDFKKSIENFDTKLQEIKDENSREELTKIVKEINSEKPNPSKIKNSWEVIKKACDSYETMSTISDVGAQVMKAAMIFV